jgi:hypothetical protein
VLQRRAEQHGTENEERDAAERGPGLLREAHHSRDFVSAEQAEQRAGHERGDEPRTAQGAPGPVGEHRRGYRDDLAPGVVDRAPSVGEDHDRRGERAGGEPAEQPVADLLDQHAHRVGLAAGAGDGREHDQQQRDADPVVEAALDVQARDEQWNRIRR